MSRLLTAITMSLLLSSASAQAIELDDAKGLKSALDSAKVSIDALKGKVGVETTSFNKQGDLNLPGYTTKPSSEANLYDKNILDKQLPYIEAYITLAAEELGWAAEKLPSWDGTNLFTKGCANVRRAHRQLEVALDKSSKGVIFNAGDFVDLEADIEGALYENDCP